MDDYFPASLGQEQKAVRVFGHGKLTIENQVQSGLNLFLKLKSPAQMMALLQTIGGAMPTIQKALKELHYVHFARFLPSQDFSTLMVITVFDGNPDAYDDSLRSYLMDFVAGLGGPFNAILEFIQDAPRLPVEEYPLDFIEFVKKNIMIEAQPWSAYPEELTVIDIQNMQEDA